MANFNKQQQADEAVKAYDAYLFANVGRGTFDGVQADLLAMDAAEACAAAALDRAANDVTRASYRALRDEFQAIAA